MKLPSILSLLILLTGATKAIAQDLTDADQIVAKANLVAFYQGADGRAETRMKIVDGKGREQVRQFTILRKDIEDGGNQLFYVLFSRPSDVKNTAFLVKKQPTGDDDRWLYLPSLDLVKRISSGDKRTSFVGSHFFYEDISGRSLTADQHLLTETTPTHYVVKNTPINPTEVEFSHYIVWIQKETFIPEKAEYFDSQGKLYRRISAENIKSIDGFPTATKMKVEDLRDGSYSVSEMRFIRYNIDLPDSVFSERSLRNPPYNWLSEQKR